MDSLQDEVLSHILSFAIPRRVAAETTTMQDLRTLSVPDHAFRGIQKSMCWLSNLRTINHQWRNVIDDPDSKLWFFVAQALELDPPLQLYSGGTYKQVCELLLAAEIERVRNPPGRPFRTACMMPAGPRVRDKHPNPERPPMKLHDAVARKLCDTAKALESFLRSVNFSLLTDHDSEWHQSSLKRYKMFLHLKQTHPTTWLIPTADIEFCWLAHIFRTKTYWDDMTALGFNPNHSLFLNKGESASFVEAVKGTAALWERMYGSNFPYLPSGFSLEGWPANEHNRRRQRHPYVARRHEPPTHYRFFPVMGASLFNEPDKVQLPALSLTAEEIQEDLEWFPQLQQGLNKIRRNQYDVQFGRGNDESLYMKHLIPSYERFLNLCYRENLDRVAPPYVLDLIWHAHQADPIGYKRDCLDLFDREFWHHPWPNGLGVSTELTSDFRCAWKAAYGSTIEQDWQLRLSDSTSPWQGLG